MEIKYIFLADIKGPEYWQKFIFDPNSHTSMANKRMLFHNRPVKAAMGSVIVNGGVRLSGGKSLVIPNL